MRRWVLIGVVVLAGCGGQAAGDDPVVRVYSSASLAGGADGDNDIVRAEQMALQEAGGRAGKFRVELKLLDESSVEGPAPPPAVAANARRAVGDDRAVAFLGDSNSEWTAAALKVTNPAGLLHVSPTSTYVGLTTRRFRPADAPTLGRVIAHDGVQSGAMVEFMRREKARRVALLDDGSLYGKGLRELVAGRLAGAGLTHVQSPRIDAAVRSPEELARALAAERVDALAYMGAVPANVIRAFHAAEPGVKIFLADSAFGANLAPELGPAEAAVRITGPAADAPAAKAFSTRFAKRFGEAPDPQVLGAYESMRAVMDAIARAGDQGAERAAVLKAFFATRRKDSVFGPYAVGADGEAGIDRYGLYRVRDRKIVPVATVTVR